MAKLFAAKDGVKSVTGTLLSYDGENITVRTGADTDVVLSPREISKLQTLYFEN